jgi:uncharacterized protein (UPF0333 family)
VFILLFNTGYYIYQIASFWKRKNRSGMSLQVVTLFLLKLDASLKLALLLSICILITFVTFVPYIHMRSTENDTLLMPSYGERHSETDSKNQTDNADVIKSVENDTNQIHGTLIVTKNIINLNSSINNKKPSDFTITVHGNNPSPSSFPGNSSGTSVKLQMGMYSVTETGPSGYNSTLLGDCSGGMMSVETKICKITNTYSNKPVISNK